MNVLRAGDAELVLAPKMGGAVQSWTLRNAPIFRTANPDARSAREHACYPLFPYSNRVANRRFSFEGTTHELPDLLMGWAIHGAGWQCPWTLDGNTMRLDYPGGDLWPFAFRAEQIFDLTETSLTVTLRLTNHHHSQAPAAIGLHPFFHRTADTRLALRTETVWLAGEDKIPTHKAPTPPEWDFSAERALGDVAVDHCFSGWDGHARIVWPERGHALNLTASEPLRHVVFYVPQGQDFFAVEPVSNRNDGLNHMTDTTDHGMRILAPGETIEGRIEMKLEHA